jgi:hypothetical protein
MEEEDESKIEKVQGNVQEEKKLTKRKKRKNKQRRRINKFTRQGSEARLLSRYSD